MKERFKIRAIVMIACVALVISIFILKLFSLQVVSGEDYLDKATSTTMVTMPVTAARGEIVDRYGRPIATNIQAYNVRLIKALLPEESLNETIIKLVELFEKNSEEWNDSTPLSKTQPYTFVAGQDAAVSEMKEKLGLAEYVEADLVYKKMIEKYDGEEIPEEYRRDVLGIRYQMESEEYSINTPFVISELVSIKTVSAIKEHSIDMPGVDVVEEAVRHYPDTSLMPHILGTIGKIDADEWTNYYKTAEGYKMNNLVGKGGIELAYEKELKGVDGRETIILSDSGQILSNTTVDAAQSGNTVMLTIDRDLQKQVQIILENQIVELQKKAQANNEPMPEGGALVVIDPKTGGVLAAATYPSYDLTKYKTSAGYQEYATDETLPLFNRAFNGLYRPGSTFKCAVAVDGLIRGTLAPTDEVFCSGKYTFWSDYQPSCTHHHGSVNSVGALKDSCNIYFYDVGRKLGIDSFNETASILGFGQKTGLEINETAGNLSTEEYFNNTHKNEEWQKGNVIQAAIGQMDTQVTPVQLATFAGSIANDGKRKSTHLIDSVHSYDFNKTLAKTETEIVSEIKGSDEKIAETFANIEEGMLQASRTGTATQFLGNYKYNIASKTGTSQNAKGFYDATIVAYGPVEDSELAIGAVVESAGNGYQLARMVRDVFDVYYDAKNKNISVQKAGILLQ